MDLYGSIWIYNDLDIWIVVVAMPTDPTWVAKSQGRVQFCVEQHVFFLLYETSNKAQSLGAKFQEITTVGL